MDLPACELFRPRNDRSSSKCHVEAQPLDASRQLRIRTFRDLWQRQQSRLDAVVRESNGDVLTDLLQFVQAHEWHKGIVEKLPTALLVLSQGEQPQEAAFAQLRERLASDKEHVMLSVSAADATNLKSLLKSVIQKASKTLDRRKDGSKIIQDQFDDRSKLLSYDLSILQAKCDSQRVQKLVLAFPNSESFDIGVLSDALMLFKSWRDRLPILVLFGVTTSAQVFHDRFSPAVLQCLTGRSFEAKQASEMLERMFELCVDEQAPMFLGPRLADVMLRRHRDHAQTIESFISAVKYAYMCHFYGNALTLFLSHHLQAEDVSLDHVQAIRNIPSFRIHSESLLERGELDHLRMLLTSDNALLEEVNRHIALGREAICWTVGGIRILHSICRHMPHNNRMAFSELYSTVMINDPRVSTIIREVLLFVKKIDLEIAPIVVSAIVDILMVMPPGIDSVSPDDFRDTQEQFSRLQHDKLRPPGPSRSKHGIEANTKTVAKAPQGFDSNKSEARHPQVDQVYSRLTQDFHDLLENLFSVVFRDYQNLFLREVLVYESKSPLRDVLSPRTRYVVERALVAPHDYLGCRCCAGEQDRMASTQPPVAILYQLHQESGLLINIADLWSAFHTIVSDQHQDPAAAMIVFVRSLAELKLLGYVKHSRKKIDHLAKLAWKGM